MTTTLVLLPGMDGTGDLFAPFITALGPEVDAQVVRYPTHQALGYAALVAQVRAALPSDRPYVLLGESFSGPIAIELAASAPPQLQGLVLCGTFARNPRPGLRPLRAVLPWLPLHWAPAWLVSHMLLGRFATPELRETLMVAVRQVAPAVLRARLQAVLDVDVSARLASIQVPTLYLQAERDRLVPPAAATLIAHHAPATQVASVDAPHGLLQAAPAVAAALIRAKFGL
jgi:pimeloyl-ACP methyl ester carboxylesterase